ncbi:hypothetical protein PQR14_00545 [Paraburkholderia bryophila]|uniref:hypothetical protein n=1 Tax=Burkholderiaceae TaxID=119060 RepID=UPI0012E08ED5|nr:hypothetical protein [Burkholderia sp. 9120]
MGSPLKIFAAMTRNLTMLRRLRGTPGFPLAMSRTYAECPRNIPMVDYLALAAEHVEIERRLRSWAERHAMRRIFDMDPRRGGGKFRRSGYVQREGAGDKMRQVISNACHVDITLSQNRNPLHRPAKGETANYREIPPR